MINKTLPPDDRQPGYYYVEDMPGVWYVWRASTSSAWTAYQERPDEGLGAMILLCGRRIIPVEKGPWG